MMLAVCLPYINTFLEDVAESLAEFENHRTQDNFDVSLTQKRFILAFIANYLPILLTAFVYIPLGDSKEVSLYTPGIISLLGESVTLCSPFFPSEKCK